MAYPKHYSRILIAVGSILGVYTLLALAIFSSPANASADRHIIVSNTGTPVSGTPAPVDITTVEPSDLNAFIIITTTVTVTPTATLTVTVTVTPTLTVTPTVTPGSSNSQIVMLPLLFRQPILTPGVPSVTTLFCNPHSPAVAIPDLSQDPNGVFDLLNISDDRIITDLNLYLDISHTFIGDLRATLTHQESGTTITLLDRPVNSSYEYCSENNLQAVLDDEMALPVDGVCAPQGSGPLGLNVPAISGMFIPDQSLSSFDGERVAGSWVLNVSDHSLYDTGYLNNWCLVGEISPAPIIPTPTPLPRPAPYAGPLPVSGARQALPLDCESRSAVDWARYFGKIINELTFAYRLPLTDNPDTGFVGDVNGSWGQIPPKPYGVHAEPVAALLRQYGLPAYAHRPLSWEALRAEITEGRPVIVWIIGSVQNGIPVYYTASDGLPTIVARYEHTVIVTGYDKKKVWFLNGSGTYNLPVADFLASWSVLGNMAITTSP